MFRLIRNLRIAWLVGVSLTLAGVSATAAEAAGLVGYRNDTTQVIVVQSTVTVNGVIRRSKPQMLYPGEVAVDGLVGQGSRRITITDPKKPRTPLFQDDVICTDDVFYSIQPKAVVMPIKGQPAKSPEVELVKTQPPRMPTRPGMNGPSNPNGPANPNKPGSNPPPKPPGNPPKKP
jgi:hypothetical protein